MPATPRASATPPPARHPPAGSDRPPRPAAGSRACRQHLPHLAMEPPPPQRRDARVQRLPDQRMREAHRSPPRVSTSSARRQRALRHRLDRPFVDRRHAGPDVQRHLLPDDRRDSSNCSASGPRRATRPSTTCRSSVGHRHAFEVARRRAARREGARLLEGAQQLRGEERVPLAAAGEVQPRAAPRRLREARSARARGPAAPPRGAARRRGGWRGPRAPAAEAAGTAGDAGRVRPAGSSRGPAAERPGATRARKRSRSSEAASAHCRSSSSRPAVAWRRRRRRRRAPRRRTGRGCGRRSAGRRAGAGDRARAGTARGPRPTGRTAASRSGRSSARRARAPPAAPPPGRAPRPARTCRCPPRR